jgi:hypothetical protein
MKGHFSGRQWNKYRQVSPKTRNLISIPVPRAGKRSNELASPEDLQELRPSEENRQKKKKFWPKYWTSFIKSPIYWPAGSRPYWQI